jgi:hypothetical protein
MRQCNYNILRLLNDPFKFTRIGHERGRRPGTTVCGASVSGLLVKMSKSCHSQTSLAPEQLLQDSLGLLRRIPGRKWIFGFRIHQE